MMLLWNFYTQAALLYSVCILFENAPSYVFVRVERVRTMLTVRHILGKHCIMSAVYTFTQDQVDPILALFCQQTAN